MAFATSPAAQTGNPAFTPSGTPSAKPGVPAPHQLNASDRTVIQQLVIGNEAEIEFGKLAAQKAYGEPVKKFAQTMVHDHDATERSVADMAKTAGLTLPSGLDSEHLALHEHLWLPVKRSPKRTANCDLAMDHSRGGMIHSRNGSRPGRGV
jgi:putative membrane protein